MLVLSRKVGESIRLRVAGDEIVDVQVVEIRLRNGRPVCRLGFTAPESVRIVRSEIDTIKEVIDSGDEN